MFCPSCNHTLQKISVVTSSGERFEVDHCGRCGGTWFDPFEINRIPYHEVSRLAKVTVIPHNHPHILREKLCPRDHIVLENFSPDSLPAKVQVHRCPRCHGLWTSQKTLEKFKKEDGQKESNIPEEKSAFFPKMTVAFAPLFFASLLIASTFLTVRSLWQTKTGRTMAAEEIKSMKVNTISPTATAISFTTRKPYKSYIEYGPSTLELSSTRVSKDFKLQHAVILSGLKPDIEYVYRIVLVNSSNNRFTSDNYSFIPQTSL